MYSLSHNSFLASSLPVGQNVVKNIIFNAAGVVLSFGIYRIFSFLAFKGRDYTSFLMFGEDLIQKGLFVFSRRFNGQALLVTALAIMMVAAGFYDTLLWALDSPGYITKTTRMNAGQLSSQMLDNPGYLIQLSNPHNNLSMINLNDTLGTNLYASTPLETVPAVVPLSIDVPPSIWLDSEGWAIGPDNTLIHGRRIPAVYFRPIYHHEQSPV
ncbi:hypothetical protein CPB84DRAFT_1796233 [Gymnopilus junonius]|uniref:Uncharacterized protein n=1 Tax=Gymnopilus junonius TaxID=109634 RepID=A0A9P5TH83_GYMJU|nr:hypothetical protein CPB84DRAFT_1796233 [Gymnopilus junonius]